MFRVLVLFCALAAVSIAHAQPVTVEVQLRLTDLDYKPLAGVPSRIVLGDSKGWQARDAGRRLTTDAKGEARFSTMAVLDSRYRKMPTNFVDSVASAPKKVDHLSAATELEYDGHRRLYVVDILRFEDGTCLLDRFRVFSPDGDGSFMREASSREHQWTMPDLDGAVVSTAGWETVDYSLQPREGDEEKRHWILKLAFKRQPPPVRR